MAYIATTSTEHQISHPLHTLPPTVISLNSRCWYPHQYHSYLWELPLLLYHKSAHSPVSLLIILLSKPWKGVKRQIRFLSILSPDWYWSAKRKKEKKKKKIPTTTHSFGQPTLKSQFLTYFLFFSPISAKYTSAILQTPGNIVPGSPKEENPNLLTSGVALSLKGFPNSAVVKNPPAKAGNTRFDPWVWKKSWRRKCQPTPVFLPGKSQGQRSQVV